MVTPAGNASAFPPTAAIPIGTSLSVEQLFGIMGSEMCEQDGDAKKVTGAGTAAYPNVNNGGIPSSSLVSPFPPPPIVHPPTQIPVGASLSVEQLFGIAGELAQQESAIPSFPPPSYCIQLLDTLQHKGNSIELICFVVEVIARLATHRRHS